MFEGTFWGLFSFVPGAEPDRFALLHLEKGEAHQYSGYYGMGSGKIPDPALLNEQTPITGNIQDGSLMLSMADGCSQEAGMNIRVEVLDPIHGDEVEISLMNGAVSLRMHRLRK